MNVWDAEHVVDEQAARALLSAQFPQLALRTIEPLGVGWDNTVYLVDDTWVVRFPRREVALPAVAREVALLPKLAPRLPLRVPVPELLGVPANGYPWPFWACRLVPGVELAEAGLLADGHVELVELVELARQVGRFLRALHQPTVAQDLGDGLPVDPMGRGDPGIRGPKTRETLDRLVARGAFDPDSPTGRAVDALLLEAGPLGPSTAERVLVHGDLHLRHVLVGPDRKATGVIDWGDACLADPAVDLALAFAMFTAEAREVLFSEYAGEIDTPRQLRARLLAVNLCAALAEHAHTEGHDALFAEYLAGMTRAVT